MQQNRPLSSHKEEITRKSQLTFVAHGQNRTNQTQFFCHCLPCFHPFLFCVTSISIQCATFPKSFQYAESVLVSVIFDAASWENAELIFGTAPSNSTNITQGQRISSECMQVRGGSVLVVFFTIHGLALAKGYNPISFNLPFLISQYLLLELRKLSSRFLKVCISLKLFININVCTRSDSDWK